MNNDKRLPSWAESLIKRLCGEYWAEGISGDLHQNFLKRKRISGKWTARFGLWFELIGLLRFLFYQKEKNKHKNSNFMVKEYFKIGFRVLVRNKMYSLINLLGLGAGMACTLLIYLWVYDEVSFDGFHENVNDLYRVEFDNGNPNTFSGSPAELGPSIAAQIPEVDMVSRYVTPRGSVIIQKDQSTFHEESYASVDPDFFKMFSFDFKQGDPGRALDDPYSIVIDERMAKKYFGNDDPIGKVLKLNNEFLMTVTGVIKEVSDNSSLQFDFVFPVEFLKEMGRYASSWASVWLTTYLKVDAEVDKTAIGSKILESIMRDKHNRWEEKNVAALVMNPVRFMRLKSYVYTGSGFEQKNLQTIYTFSGLGLLILLIACINFMNLATARSAKRAKEIGMRKVVGAVKQDIRSQFLGEALLQTCVSTVLAIILVVLLLEPFNTLSGKQVEFERLLEVPFIASTIVVVLLVSLFAGSYPAFYLSNFRPIRVLKGQFTRGMKSGKLRKTLVVVQFGLSIFLIIATLVIYYQMDFIRNKELGYDKEQVLYIPLVHDETREAFKGLKAAWLNSPEVSHVSAAQVKPSRIGWSSSGYWEGKDPEDNGDIYHNRVEMDYLKTLGIQILEGRDFGIEFLSDDAEDGMGGFVINETLAQRMSPDGEALGMTLLLGQSRGPIVGIVPDFHFSSLKFDIQSIALVLKPKDKSLALVKLNSDEIRKTIESIEATWNSLLPNYPFEFHFLDEDIEKMYRKDEQLGNLLGTFSLLAIIIASLGLFGLASFTADERRREVAIRKVLGATHSRITYLLCKDFLVLVVIANLIAWPLGWWVMKGWLDGFAYRFDLGLDIFFFAGILALVIAVITIVFQTIKVAMANPVVALKYE